MLIIILFLAFLWVLERENARLERQDQLLRAEAAQRQQIRDKMRTGYRGGSG